MKDAENEKKGDKCGGNEYLIKYISYIDGQIKMRLTK